VRFDVVRDDLVVVISDDGLGMLSSGHHGRGLNNIRHRAARLNGELDVESSGKGTLLRIRLPMRHALIDRDVSG